MTDTQTPERIWVDYTPYTESYADVSPVEEYGYTEFINIDLHAAVVAERDQLKAKLTELEKHRA